MLEVDEVDRYPAIDKALEVLRSRLAVSGRGKDLSMSADSLLQVDDSIMSTQPEEVPRSHAPQPTVSSKRPLYSKPSLQSLARLYVDDWYPAKKRSHDDSSKNNPIAKRNNSIEKPDFLLQRMLSIFQDNLDQSRLVAVFQRLQVHAARKKALGQRLRGIERHLRSGESDQQQFSLAGNQRTVQRLGKDVLAVRFHALKLKKKYFLKMLRCCFLSSCNLVD